MSNYLQEVGDELAKKLAGLDQKRVREIVWFVQAKVADSYRNGYRAGQESPQAPTSAPRRDGRARGR